MRRITIIGIGIIILLLAISLRLFGVKWDNGTHLHPDERFLTMVATDLQWTNSLASYFDTNTSTLNPQNRNHSFYVYGTWPVLLTKFVAETFNMGTYGDIPIVGRILVSIFDCGIVILVYLITFTVTKKMLPSLVASFLYATAVLPIQLSHFFAVDIFAVFFMTLTLLLVVRKKFGLALGIVTGLAVSAKITGIFLLPIVGLGYLANFKWKKKLFFVLSGLLFVIGFVLTVRVAFPYLFDGYALNPKVLQNWKELKSFDGDQTGFPPALQWIGTVKLLYPLSDMLVWGLGIPLGILVIGGVFYNVLRPSYAIVLLLIWIATIFFYQGSQFAKAMRYMAPIYPALAVLTGIFVWKIFILFSTYLPRLLIWLFAFSFISVLLVWPLAYVRIYTKETTRLTASKWIYANIPAGATIAWEQWDDPLPLSVDSHNISEYQTIPLPMYDPDTPENVHRKWTMLADYFYKTDYLVLSSNRAYGGISRAKKRFPVTYAYYKGMFDGSLGYTKVQEFYARPHLPLPWGSLCLLPPGYRYGELALPLVTCTPNMLEIVDDFAEESFTVYDHPKVIIMKNTGKLPPDAFLKRLPLP